MVSCDRGEPSKNKKQKGKYIPRRIYAVTTMAWKEVKCYNCTCGRVNYTVEDDEGNEIEVSETCGRCGGSGWIKEYSDEDKL